MGKDTVKLKKLRKEVAQIGKRVSKTGPCIIWNLEQSKEMHGTDFCTDFHFFIKYKNPENILDKIDRIFDERLYKSIITKQEHSKGHIKGTVNDYMLITYTTLLAPEKISFGWTEIPSKFDKNFSRDYKKGGSLEGYISDYINN